MDYILERLIKVEEKTKSNTIRINDHDKKLDNIHDLTVAVKEIAMETKATREDVNEMNERLKEVEDRPVQHYDKIITTVIGTIVGGIVGALIGLILK